ncbi:CHY zinc finger protein [Fasciola gigantica]|uniref:CHY zinc finger protein n=1 Tax=Fasciola gigantica TaxID=46835 RepID=A0A504YYQ3_FASGI|nr:CHY zinc finger protein [Fasciola gigantica]
MVKPYLKATVYNAGNFYHALLHLFSWIGCMNRVHVCHYYQAGCCRNGDACQFTHPTVRCRSFTATGWCPYGFNCHFWHDYSVKPSAPNLPRKPCQFFVNNQCKYGDRCTFSHDIENENKNCRTLKELRATENLPRLSLSNRGPSLERSSLSNPKPEHAFSGQKSEVGRASSSPSGKSGTIQTPAQGDSLNRVNRPVFIRPRNSTSGTPLEGVTKAEICRLQHFEMERFLKSNSKDKLREIQSFDDGRVFHLKFSSTDPDWAYDVREVVLNIYVNKMYPAEPLQVTVINDDNLPDVLIEHLNMAMSSWIHYKHQQLSQANRMELYMRPFFQWLDRNLENLFTQGLRKYKAQLTGEPSQAVLGDARPHTRSRDSSRSHNSDIGSTTALLLGAGTQSSLGSDKSDNCSSGSIGSTRSHSEKSRSSGSDSDDACSNNHIVRTSDIHNEVIPNDFVKQQVDHEPEYNEAGEWIEPVIRKNKEKFTTGQKPESQFPASVLKTELPNPVPVNGPTQSFFLTDLNIRGKAGTVTPRRVTCALHCTRCRLSFNWCFNFPGYSRPNGLLEHSPLRSLPPHGVTCARCRQSMEFVFLGLIAHAFENRLGTLHLKGCIADDVPPKRSDLSVLCTECNQTIKFNNVEPGRQQMRHCFKCHSLVGLVFSGFQLEKSKCDVVDATVTQQSKTNLDTTAKELSRRLRRAMNSAKNPIIQDGTPLPDYGACKHYRKSYRWLRFPCCGRLEPCDVCHDLNSIDDHEMEFANRMICGFCSKEQPFSATQPCIRCSKSLSGARTAHWEGGKGCRNRVTMSRKDTKKYAQRNKTISNKK